MGNWKGIIQRPGKEMELYNLNHDISERYDLAKTFPDVIAEIRSTMQDARIPERAYKPEARKMTVVDFVQLK